MAEALMPLIVEQSAKKLKMKAAPGDLNAPKWPGELEVTSKPDKLIIFEAARLKYEATCIASDHAPTPIHEAFDVEVVPTLRRWLKMPKGTALCPDWVILAPSLDAAIIPLLKSKFLVVSGAFSQDHPRGTAHPHFHRFLARPQPRIRRVLSEMGHGHFCGATLRSLPLFTRPRRHSQGSLRRNPMPGQRHQRQAG
jgi:hypothetical protein